MQALICARSHTICRFSVKYQAEYEVNYRLMEHIDPYCVATDGCEPFDMRRIAEFREPAVLGDYTEIASCQEQEEPRHHREVIRGSEAGVMQSEREQYAYVICFHREMQLEQVRDSEISGKELPAGVCHFYVHREDEQQYADRNSHPGGKQVEKLLTQTEQHHADAEEVQDPEKNRPA